MTVGGRLLAKIFNITVLCSNKQHKTTTTV